ncbi:phosphotransferase enzyme family protein [Streptomyces puniciscabiei]|uniref:phosphotransferase enzyme family protein n=1 Tax=Streptomyces puniciscabiei TaxID=164348 RepID=UPI00332E5E50
MDAAAKNDGLTEASAGRAMAAACSQAGLSSGQAELLRLGENAIYALATDQTVVRVARSDTEETLRKVQKELLVARWLMAQNFPAVAPREDIAQPIRIEGRLVTFWEYVPPSPVEPTLTDLGGLLRDLHSLPAPEFCLPLLDPFPIMERRLALAQGVPQADVDYLAEACIKSQAAFHSIMSDAPKGVIHGDAHRGNLLARGSQVLLIDYEAVAIGPQAWDLIPTATAVDRFGLSPGDYAVFCRTYGQDVTDWPGYGPLRTVRELGMTTWLMQMAQSGKAAAEFAVRMESLRKEERDRRWHAL